MKLKNMLIVVKDIERSKAFYRGLFGLDVLTEFEGNVILTEGLVLQDANIWESCINKTIEFGTNVLSTYIVKSFVSFSNIPCVLLKLVKFIFVRFTSCKFGQFANI